MATNGGQADWREAAAYAPLLDADRSIFAWEWLRRHPGYRDAAARLGARTDGRAFERCGSKAAEAWGLHAFEAPDRPAPLARPVWTAAVHPFVLPAGVEGSGAEEDMLDLERLGERAVRVNGSRSSEHLLVSDGLHTIRVDVAGAFNKRARLRYRIGGIVSAERPLLTLRRLVAFAREGRFSRTLHPREAKASRWILLLRAFDALAAGADQRKIAEALLSAEAGEERWRSRAPSLRSRAQRLVRGARRMAAGGYWELLR